MSQFTRKAAFLFFLALSSRAFPEPVTVDEFRRLAAELAPKVNLFRDIWAQDPSAELFGGTSRDFLYWLKGQLRTKSAAELRKLQVIDVREFIAGDSDVDILSDKTWFNIEAAKYNVRKLDTISRDRLDPRTEAGRTERDQGYIPVEKIRLTRTGLVDPKTFSDFGDGVKEIHEGKLTAQFTPRKTFDATSYARQGKNHPSFLALRYIRLVSMNYYYEHGRALPDKDTLLILDPATETAVRRVLRDSPSDPALRELMKNEAFVKKMNDTVHKAFRTYTNPSAALMLYDHLGASELVRRNDTKIQPINQYLFAKHRDNGELEANRKGYAVDEAAFFLSRDKIFPDGKLYHGTRSEEAFRSILLVGVLPSVGGTAGNGLYGVPDRNIGFATEYAGGPERVVSLEVKDGAKIVDITTGEGKRVYELFRKKTGGDESAFAEFFGADIVRYKYHTEAYVVKNSEALGRVQGHVRQVLTFGKLVEWAETIHDEAAYRNFAESVKINGLTAEERRIIYDSVPFLKKTAAGTTDIAGFVRLVTLLKDTDAPRKTLEQTSFPGAKHYVQKVEEITNEPLRYSQRTDRKAREILLYEIFASFDAMMKDPQAPQAAAWEARAKEGFAQLYRETFRWPFKSGDDRPWDAEGSRAETALKMLDSVAKTIAENPNREASARWLDKTMKENRAVTEAGLRELTWWKHAANALTAGFIPAAFWVASRLSTSPEHAALTTLAMGGFFSLGGLAIRLTYGAGRAGRESMRREALEKMTPTEKKVADCLAAYGGVR